MERKIKMTESDQLITITGGGVTSPLGYLASGVAAGIKESGKPDMAMIMSEVPANFSASFTTCKFQAAPVQLDSRKTLEQPFIQAVTVNSGNANACTGKVGYHDAEEMCKTTGKVLDISPDAVMVCSTGKIGDRLPMDKINAGIEHAGSQLSADGGAAAAKAIMTTDLVSKEAAVKFMVNGKTVTVGGMTKGSGMIAPRMTVPHATMLAFITTDAKVENALLGKLLSCNLDKSFNSITVDGDMSTNDTLILMANGKSGVEITDGSPEAELLSLALAEVMGSLAKQIVMDGEGVTKFVTLNVGNARSVDEARACATAVSNSLLCKTAWFGCDPNWGRILAAAGRSGAKFDPEKFSLYFDEFPVVENGSYNLTSMKELAEVMKKPEFTVWIDLNSGSADFTMWTNDLSYDYVKINAEYHT